MDYTEMYFTATTNTGQTLNLNFFDLIDPVSFAHLNPDLDFSKFVRGPFPTGKEIRRKEYSKLKKKRKRQGEDVEEKPVFK